MSGEPVKAFDGDTIALDVTVDFLLMVVVVTERGERLREGEVGECARDFLWGRAHAPQFDEGANWRARAANDRFSTEDLIIDHDVKLLGCLHHDSALPLYSSRVEFSAARTTFAVLADRKSR